MARNYTLAVTTLQDPGRARDRAGLDTWSYHDLRHFFISELFRSGVPAHLMRALARHSALQTTQRYADLDATDLRAAIDLLDVSRDPGNVVMLTTGSV